MTKPDLKKLRLLLLLIGALALTLYIGSRMNRPANPEVVQAQAPKLETDAPVQGDARIRLDLLNKRDADQGVGKKNLFQYQPKPVPPPPPQVVQSVQNPVFTGPPGPPPPPVTPPPPPIPLKYIGFAYVEPNSKALIATMIDDQLRHFLLVEGDVYLGRYRVTRITDAAVDIEDLQLPRRQTLPLAKQQ